MGQLPRERRIRTRIEIGELLRAERERGSTLELFARPAREARARATCITPKHGRTSVARNRLRRRLKALAAELLLDRGEPRDWLIRSRPEAYDLAFAELREELAALADRLDPPTPERRASTP